MNHLSNIKTAEAHLATAGPKQQLFPNTVLKQLFTNRYLTANLIAHRNLAVDLEHIGAMTLYEKMRGAFNLQEVKAICFELPGVDFEEIAGSVKSEKLQELIRFMQRQNRLPELIKICGRHNRSIEEEWEPDPNGINEMSGVRQTVDLAIVIDIARPILHSVGSYLDQINLESNMIHLTATGGRLISPDIGWEPFFSSFSELMNQIKREFGSPKLHFFLSAPGPLLFGFGAIMGTVDDVLTYHFQDGSYFPIEIKRLHRSGK